MGMRTLVVGTLAVVLAAAAQPQLSRAGTGDLDPTFGSGGIATATLGTGFVEAALQPDGAIVVAGSILPPGEWRRLLVARFLPDGTPDPAFGTGGRVVVDHGPSGTSVGAVVVQPDGRILVGGFYGAIIEARLTRLLPDGTLDASFGTGGIVGGFPPTFPLETVSDLALQSDGAILATGRAVDPVDGFVFGVARFLADGSLDPDFGDGGASVVDYGGPFASDLALQPDGKIVVGGTTQEVPLLMRFLPDGTLDATFGNGGIAAVVASRARGISDLALQADGKIVGVGIDSVSPAESSMFRWNGDGTRDASFGTNGAVPLRAGAVGTHGPSTNPIDDLPTSVLVQPDGRLVVAMSAGWELGDGPTLVLLRFLPDGTIDGSFGFGGYAEIRALSRGNLLQLADGRLVVTGRVSDDTVGLARVDTACPALPDGDADGIGDACDPCTNGANATKPKLSVRQMTPPLGNDGLIVGAQAVVPGPIDPVATGFRLRLTDAGGAILLDSVVPGGTYHTTFRAGWTRNQAGTTFKYKNAAHDPGGFVDPARVIDGIRQVTAKVRSSGEVVVKLKAREGAFPFAGAALPIDATIVLDRPRAATGRCIELPFTACALTPTGTTLSCK